MSPRDRRRLLLVINDLRRAGAETQLVRLACGLDRARHDVRIVLIKARNDFAAELAAAAIPVTALQRRGPADLDVLRRLRQTIRQADPDIVHSWLFMANLHTVLSTRVARVPALVLSQRSSYDTTLPAFWRHLARWTHRLADRVIVNSQAALDEELAAGLPPSLLVHVPNGITVPAAPPAANREALGVDAGPLVVCVAQLSVEKGHPHLLDAWPRVLTQAPDAQLVLIGEGPERGGLEAQARHQNFGPRVRFAGAQQPAPWLAAADVVVLPSLTEGQPNAVLEAMAAGRPVVATRVGGLPELIEDGATGLLVPPADPAAMAAAVCRVIGDRGWADGLGRAARQRVALRFTTERLVAATEAVYAGLPSPMRTGC